jgi:apolipoprotein N-acyltransferase
MSGLGFISGVAWSAITIDLQAILFRQQKQTPDALLQANAIGYGVSLLLCSLIWINNKERIFVADMKSDSIVSCGFLALALAVFIVLHKQLLARKSSNLVNQSTILILNDFLTNRHYLQRFQRQ